MQFDLNGNFINVMKRVNGFLKNLLKNRLTLWWHWLTFLWTIFVLVLEIFNPKLYVESTLYIYIVNNRRKSFTLWNSCTYIKDNTHWMGYSFSMQIFKWRNRYNIIEYQLPCHLIEYNISAFYPLSYYSNITPFSLIDYVNQQIIRVRSFSQ